MNSFPTKPTNDANSRTLLPPWEKSEEQIDQRLTSFNSRYTFSAKEKDIETGYSYFGARYYTSDLSIWLSVDPMSDKYPSTSPYAYCRNNPVMLIDPNGKDDYFTDNGVFLGTDGTSSDKVRIIKQETWDKYGKNMSFEGNDGTTVISGGIANFLSTDASEAGLTDKATLGIYEHYNTTGYKLGAMEKSQDDGKFGMTIDLLSKTIDIRIEGNKQSKVSDHFNEIKSLFVHELKHKSDFDKGYFGNKDQGEIRAVNAQINDPTFNKTRSSFQNSVKAYGEKFGMKF